MHVIAAGLTMVNHAASRLEVFRWTMQLAGRCLLLFNRQPLRPRWRRARNRCKNRMMRLPHSSGIWRRPAMRPQRAQRQYDAADPENRLVTGELERRWNQTL